MSEDGGDSFAALQETVWAHIDAERFAQAESALRKLIERIEPDDADRCWHYCGLMAGVLNSLGRAEEGTEMYRRALAEARRTGHPPTIGAARYMMAKQYVLFGQPRDALAEATPVARTAARDAIAACPTEDRWAQLSEQLAYILGTG